MDKSELNLNSLSIELTYKLANNICKKEETLFTEFSQQDVPN